MRIKQVLITVFLITQSFLWSQNEEIHYHMDKSSKLILSSSKMNEAIEVSENLSSGEKIQIKWFRGNFFVSIKDNNNEEDIIKLDYENDNIINIYEYDFDGDKNKELIIINSLNEGDGKIYIYRRSGTFVKKCGIIDLGIGISLNNSLIKVYTGIRDYYSTYVYDDKKIWQLCSLD